MIVFVTMVSSELMITYTTIPTTILSFISQSTFEPRKLYLCMGFTGIVAGPSMMVAVLGVALYRTNGAVTSRLSTTPRAIGRTRWASAHIYFRRKCLSPPLPDRCDKHLLALFSPWSIRWVCWYPHHDRRLNWRSDRRVATFMPVLLLYAG